MADFFRDYAVVAKSGLFDAEYYMAAYPDVAVASMDPLTHYLERGAVELRNPSKDFDARRYVQLCLERGERIENPLLHYIKFGAAHGFTSRISQKSKPHRSDDKKTRSKSNVPVLPQFQFGLDRVRVESGRGATQLRGSGWYLAPSQIVELNVALGAISARARLRLPRSGTLRESPHHPNADRAGFDFTLGPIPDEVTGLVELNFTARPSLGDAIHWSAPIDLGILRAAAALHGDDRRARCFCELLEVTLGGQICIQGWAVAAEATERISVLLDGNELGDAVTGIARSDVGNHFPALAHALRSGFSFRHDVAAISAGKHLVTLRHVAGGESTEFLLPVLAKTRSGLDRADNASAHSGREELLLSIDLPQVIDGAMVTAIRGNLEIAGWALARRKIESIDIAIDGVRLKSISTGIRRIDVQRAFENWDGALTAGFSTLLPHRSLSKGPHTVSIVLRDEAGRIARSEFRVVVEEAPDTDGPWALRRRMTPVELELSLRPLVGKRRPPSFGVLVPLPIGAKALKAARSTLASLSAQAYENWRVYFVTRSNRHKAVRRELLHGFNELSNRIEVLAGDAAARRLLLTESACSHLMILRSGDELGCDALLEFALQATLHPQVDFLYSDERRMSPSSGKVEAFFKPQWSPDLLLSMNYLGRAWCARTELFSRAAIRPQEFVSGGSYHLSLRLTEHAEAIRHIPATLVQAAGSFAEEFAVDRKALQRALTRRGIAATVERGRTDGTFRIRRALTTRGLVSIIIPTCASRGLIRTCIETLRKVTAYRDFEIICIENIPAGEEDWKRWLRAHADQVMETTEPFNWSKYNNRAVAAARGEFLLFLNDDIEITDPDWLDALLEHAQRPEVGAVGPQLLYPDRQVQHAGMFLAGSGVARHAFRGAAHDDPGYFGLALTERNIIAVTGACLMTRRETFEALGGFDDTHDIVNNDLDFCLRILGRGLRTIYTPHASLVHHELVSRSEIPDKYDTAAFARKWRSIFVAGDPFFNPRLTKGRDDYSVEWEATEMHCAGNPVLLPKSIRRILVVKLDHIGDCVIALASIRRLKRHFPWAKISVLTGRASKSVWAMEPAVEEIMEFDFFHARSASGLAERSEDDWLALRARLAPHRFDLAVDLRRHWETRPVLQYTGARYLAGFDMKGKFPWLDVAIESFEDSALLRKHQHATDDLNNLVDAVASAGKHDRTAFSKLPVPLSAAALAKLPNGRRIFGKRVVCVHPSAGNELRQWPPEYFSLLIDQLIETEDVHIILIGRSDEVGVGTKVLKPIANRQFVWSLIGKLAIDQLPSLIARCSLFVGNNSGPQHIAAGLGVPTVGIHSGVVDAREWGPRGINSVAIQRAMTCSPCYHSKIEGCMRRLACLRGLLPADVFPVCQRLLRISMSGAGSAPEQRRSTMCK